jgi:hypothetical protein
MALELTGKIFSFLPEQTGAGKNGAWVRQDFIVETQEQYPKKVCLSAWGDKVAILKNFSVGDTVKASFNAESREYNGRWYTDLRIWKLEGNTQKASAEPTQNSNDDILNQTFTNEEGSDDLPF